MEGKVLTGEKVFGKMKGCTILDAFFLPPDWCSIILDCPKEKGVVDFYSWFDKEAKKSTLDIFAFFKLKEVL
jgi:hypothetical protein